MFYLKTIHAGKPIEIEFYGDELYCRCFKCGKEFQVDDDLQREVLKNDGSFCGISMSCGCDTTKPQLTRIK